MPWNKNRGKGLIDGRGLGDDEITPHYKTKFRRINNLCHECGKSIPILEASWYYHKKCKKLIKLRNLESRRKLKK